MSQLTGSVGRHCQNRTEDTKLVQKLINAKLPIPLAPLKEDGFCGERTIFAITEYQRRNLAALFAPDGIVTPGGATFRSLTGNPKAPPTPGGKKYTTHANEVPVEHTAPSRPAVVKAVKAAWAELTESGARTLAAQYAHETSDGAHCYNWNLGNEKSGVDQLHMYLQGTWECYSSGAAQAAAEKPGSMARLATTDEIKKKGWVCPATKVAIAFSPPHPTSRFRAYSSLDDGAVKWTGRYKKLSARKPDFLKALNAGDTAGVAKTLASEGYFTGSESVYANNLAKIKADIDSKLGPAK